MQVNSSEAIRPAPSAVSNSHRDRRRVGRRVTIGAYCARAHKRTKRMNRTIYDVLWVAAVFRFLYLFIIILMR